MLPQEVEASILALFGLGSVLSFVVRHLRSGSAIRLPIEDDDVDLFRILDLEDVDADKPIDKGIFWRHATIRKAILSMTLTATLDLQLVSGDFVANLRGVFTLYLLVISLVSFKRSLSLHSASVVHLATLTTVAVAILVLDTILPGSPPRHNLSTFVLGLYVLAWLIAVTTRRGPPLQLPLERIYTAKEAASRTNPTRANVVDIFTCSPADFVLFTYAGEAVRLGGRFADLSIADFPVVPRDTRAPAVFARMRATMRRTSLRFARPGSGFGLAYHIYRANRGAFAYEVVVTVLVSGMFYAPKWMIKLLIEHLERAGADKADRRGWLLVAGIFVTTAIAALLFDQFTYIAQMVLQVRIAIQLNTMLFAKTLVRKDISSTSSVGMTQEDDTPPKAKPDDDEEGFSSKAQVMTLMTTDVERVGMLPMFLFGILNCPLEIAAATWILYNLLGVSCFVGLAVAVITLPMNHYAGNLVVGAQGKLMKARDERVSLMNEILGAIRMLKFMAWERRFEDRVTKIRNEELHWQKRTFHIQVALEAIWNSAPIFITLLSFYHFAIVRGEQLTPSIAFTSIAVFSELRYAISNLPETMIKILQAFVSLRRMERYMQDAEISPSDAEPGVVALRNASVTWPQMVSKPSSVSLTPSHRFMLVDMAVDFPKGELSLICGKLGSGKTLLLLALLGEADVLAGQVVCPRSRPDAIATLTKSLPKDSDWVLDGVSAYVPQTAWLRNASIRDNILFDLPYSEERYRKTVEACALIGDFKILEDGDESEIGERGIGLSGGQKARVSLARAVYSRASTILLDDVLSAVDAHTADFLYHNCLKGELMRGRTVILVSHHVRLCAPGASHVVVLDRGQMQFSGGADAFYASGLLDTLVHSSAANVEDDEVLPVRSASSAETVVAEPEEKEKEAKARVAPRKLVEDETAATGSVSRRIYGLYAGLCGHYGYWIVTVVAIIVGGLVPVIENGWLRTWSASTLDPENAKDPMFYIGVYAGIRIAGLIVPVFRWAMMVSGSIRASKSLYKNLLESILFAPIRFHDTASKGRLLNRFGKDFEVIDSQLLSMAGRVIFEGIDMVAVFVVMCAVGGPFFVAPILVLGLLTSKVVGGMYAQTARQMRRLSSISVSPLYGMYGEAISGVTVLRAFGASTKYMRDMMRYVDMNANPTFWQHCSMRWLDVRLGQLANLVLALIGVAILISPSIDASLAGFVLSLAASSVWILTNVAYGFVGMEQAMVAVERVKEYTDVKSEAPEITDVQPPADWPSAGEIECKDLVIRYAPELPAVLHSVSFKVKAGEKVGILGRTGSGKSTLAMSLFRFVELSEGQILVDGLDVSEIGLTDLRGRLTIIPQDPVILSGTLRSTLDVFGEYEDSQIFDALRRVHLIPPDASAAGAAEVPEMINVNVFRNLDSAVSESGDNFSTGEKQLLCMARAILKHAKILVMDEATASVDYATDELIGKTIREQFAGSTILTIAHRLRTVIDYDRVMVLDEGRVVEFGSPAQLLAQDSSQFHALCKATGKDEFSILKKLATH